jgi:hypothetical protein
MFMFRFVAAAVASLVLAGAAFAGNDLHFAPFSAINAHGGARVVLRHGKIQRVTILEGNIAKGDVHLSGKTLEISACRMWCVNTQTFLVEIVSPQIDVITAHTGGAVEAKGDFPKQPNLRLSAHTGGAIDAAAIPTVAVRANAHTGGAIQLKALDSIQASAYAGGMIHYSGEPAHISSSSYAGGAVGRH